jgi:ABC-type Na+ efflux pump permease subunit
MLNFEPEEPEFGCGQTFLAYLAAVYMLAAPFSFLEINAPDFWVILFTPLILPFVACFGLFLGENSEAGSVGEGVAYLVLFFVAVFGVMLFLVRQGQKRPWVGWLLGSIIVGMLIASYCQTS